MAQNPDPYQVLGVARGATKAQIKAAHRALAKRYHPDAASGDSQRFRDVHEAYQLLADPLRRREWDARHAPGPVRADEPTKPSPRRRRTPPEEAGPLRPEASRTYRWSASEVPWWEDGARSENRRQPGARRPRSSTQSPGAEEPTADAPPAGGPTPITPPPRTAADFDVYNRSSGAAWSSAARRYFRRFDDELPRHGQFRRQGTQPLTAARARVAAEEEARAQAEAAAARPAPAPRRTAPPRPAEPRDTAAPPRPAPPPPPPVAPPPPRPVYAYAAGVAHTTEQVNAARAATQRAIRAATWPTLRERLIYALLAWIPLALLVGYGGTTATGCDHAAVSCPAWFGPAQSVTIAVLLGLLVAMPRIAFVGAVATLATTAASVVIVAFLAIDRLEPPFPSAIVVVGGSILVGVYLLTIAVVGLNRSALPWVARR
jgi:curved DNA-binding protein CbpA